MFVRTRPNPVSLGIVSHQTNLGVANYALEPWLTPGNSLFNSLALYIAPPVHRGNFYNTRVYDASRYHNHGTITGCLDGNSLVYTPQGAIPISRIKADGEVDTSYTCLFPE